MTFALVLGGGGTSGVAWETGLLTGLRDGGLDLACADLLVGTSAGAIVAAQLATGCDLDDLYRRQTVPAEEPGAPEAAPDLTPLRQAMAQVARSGGATKKGLTEAARAEIGAMAVAAKVETEENRLRKIGSWLPFRRWPDRRLLITAVDVSNGAFVVWNSESGIPLLQAVASSCAAPMVRPPTSINGRRYMDGGMRSGINADLARGYDLVVVIAVTPVSVDELSKPDGEIADLRSSGSDVHVLVPDGFSRQAIFPNLLDPARGVACAQAGYAQGLALTRSWHAELAACQPWFASRISRTGKNLG